MKISFYFSFYKILFDPLYLLGKKLDYRRKKFELKNFSKTKKLLQLLRNESHRFAINHHRKRRSKNLLKSNLDDIRGLGPKLKLNLIRYFGGADKVMEASKDDLKAVPGIGVSKANQIFRFIKNQ